MRELATYAAFAFIIGNAACAAPMARGAEVYRNETQKVLETRSAQLKSCYDGALKADGAAAGTVTVRFVVEKRTGAFGQAAIVPAKSSAPEAVVRCLLGVIDGLKLAPPDANEGQATFIYEFRPAPAPT